MAQLPLDVRQRAREAFALWKRNRSHPSLHFKQIRSKDPVYSVRIALGWRALAVRSGDEDVWFWIGSHAEYDNVI